MRLFPVFVLPALLLATVTIAPAKSREPFPGTEDKWRRYESPHFELYSATSDTESRQLLRNLEVMRVFFFETLKLTERSPVAVTVYFFRDRSDFDHYKPERLRKNDSIAAGYQADPDRGVLYLAPSAESDEALKLGFQGYIYHLFRVGGEMPPAWMAYGYAELFSTLEIRSESMIFGKTNPNRVQQLQRERLLPLDRLLAIDYQDPIFASEERSMIYHSQVWALVHYMILGQHKIPPAQIDRFVNYARQHAAHFDANAVRAMFQECFGFGYDMMNRRLESYVVTGRYSYSKLAIPKVPPLESYASQPASRDEMVVRLAELSLRINRDPSAKLQLLDTAGRDPNNARIHEVLGSDSMKDQDADQARDRWMRAVEAGSSNPTIFHQLGMMESQRWFRQFDYYFRLTPEKTEQLRTLLLRSIEGAPSQAAAYEMLAWVESAAPKPSIANVNLIQGKFSTLVNTQNTLLALALIRIRLGEPETGLGYLAQLEKMDPSEDTLQNIEVIRAQLENRPPVRFTKKQPEKPTIRVNSSMNLPPIR